MNATQSPGRHRQSLKRCHGNTRRLAATVATLAVVSLTGASAASASTSHVARYVHRVAAVETLNKTVPVNRVATTIPPLEAAGWTCVTDGVLHSSFGTRSYDYVCTRPLP